MSTNFNLSDIFLKDVPLASSAPLLALWRWQNLVPLIVSLWVMDIVYKCTPHLLGNVPVNRGGISIYFRGSWHHDAAELQRKYGSMVRVAPKEVNFVAVAALQDLYEHRNQFFKVCDGLIFYSNIC
jgi:hypothetical protein